MMGRFGYCSAQTVCIHSTGILFFLFLFALPYIVWETRVPTMLAQLNNPGNNEPCKLSLRNQKTTPCEQTRCTVSPEFCSSYKDMPGLEPGGCSFLTSADGEDYEGYFVKCEVVGETGKKKGGKKEKEERITQDKKPLLYFTIVPVTPHSSLFLLTLSTNSFFFPHPSPTRQNVPSWTSLFNSLQLISMNFSPRIHHSSQQVNYVSST